MDYIYDIYVISEKLKPSDKQAKQVWRGER
jgi:hypothetical protein